MSGNQKLIMVIFSGLGISTSRNGNAFLTAQPEIFFNIWNNNPHFLLNTKAPEISDAGFWSEPEVNFSSISKGESALPYLDVINQDINVGSFQDKEILRQSLTTANDHFSAIHLIGVFSNDDFYSSTRHLLAILEAAKKNNCGRLFLHLIIDNSFADRNELVTKLKTLNDQVSQSDVARLSTLSGIGYCLDKSYKNLSQSKAFQTICFGRGIAALSVEQAVSLGLPNSQNTGELTPSFLSENGKPVSVVSDFDQIIFFNHNPLAFERLIFSFVQDTPANDGQFPKMIQVYPLTDRLTCRQQSIKPIYTSSPFNSLPSLLSSSGIKSTLLTESFMSDIFIKFFLAGFDIGFKCVTSPVDQDYVEKFPYTQEEILNHLISSLKQGESDLTIIHFPFLSNIVRLGNFANAIFALRIFDKIIEALARIASQFKRDLLLTSAYGGIENILSLPDRDNFIPTKNPVPLIYIPKDSCINNPSGVTEISLNDILSTSHTLYDIAPTVLDLFDIPKQENYNGLSLLHSS